MINLRSTKSNPQVIEGDAQLRHEQRLLDWYAVNVYDPQEWIPFEKIRDRLKYTIPWLHPKHTLRKLLDGLVTKKIMMSTRMGGSFLYRLSDEQIKMNDERFCREAKR